MTGNLLDFNRWAPNAAIKLQPIILNALADGQWRNITEICKMIGRSSEDGAMRYWLKRMADRGVIDRKVAPSKTSRYGYTYVFKRRD